MFEITQSTLEATSLEAVLRIWSNEQAPHITISLIKSRRLYICSMSNNTATFAISIAWKMMTINGTYIGA